MEGFPSICTQGRREGGDPLNQCHLNSEWPLSVPQFPLDHSRVLTISDSGDTAQGESPGRPEVPKSSSGFPRGQRCSTAVGLDCLQGRREPGGPWSSSRGLNLPDRGRVHPPVPGTCSTRAQGLARAGTAQRASWAPFRPATSCCRPVPASLQLQGTTKLLTMGPRPEQQW